MKNFLRCGLYQTMRKRVDETALSVRQLALSEKAISYFNLSSHPILSFTYEGTLYYFRECPRLRTFEAYVKNAIDTFFQSIYQLHINEEHFKQTIPIRLDFSSEEVASFREYVQSLLLEKAFLNTLSYADRISQKQGFSIWDPREYTKDFFGAYGLGDLPDGCYDIAVYFLWYMRNSAAEYRTLRLARGEQYSYFSAVRSVAGRIVAEALEVSSLMTTAEFCRLVLDNGAERFGVLSPAADGSRMKDTDVPMTGSLQRELLNLNLLDMVCFQTDHGVNNYNVFERDGAYAVCAFDNDNPYTFLPIPTIRRNFLGCSSLVDRDGYLYRPLVDQQLFRNIQNLNVNGLKKQLKPYLNRWQRWALGVRIRKIQTMLNRSVRRMPTLAVGDAAWNDQTVAEELSGRYGTTYLTLASKARDC